jgi:hypothetical protein
VSFLTLLTNGDYDHASSKPSRTGSSGLGSSFGLVLRLTHSVTLENRRHAIVNRCERRVRQRRDYGELLQTAIGGVVPSP